MVLHRIALPFINACFITALLFVFMYSLIDIGDPELSSPFILPKVIFVHVPPEESVETIIAKDPKPKLVDELPDVPTFNPDFKYDGPMEQDWVEYKRESITGDELFTGDHQLVITLGFPPEYPRGPLSRGVEGYAIVGFSVSKTGSVFDPYIIESEPRGVFDRSALKGILKFKYKARVVDGHPVVTEGQQYQFTYRLEN
jgi:protein TonB